MFSDAVVVATSKVFLCHFDIKLLHHFDIINQCLSHEKRNDHKSKYTEKRQLFLTVARTFRHLNC